MRRKWGEEKNGYCSFDRFFAAFNMRYVPTSTSNYHELSRAFVLTWRFVTFLHGLKCYLERAYETGEVVVARCQIKFMIKTKSIISAFLEHEFFNLSQVIYQKGDISIYVLRCNNDYSDFDIRVYFDSDKANVSGSFHCSFILSFSVIPVLLIVNNIFFKYS